MRWPARGRCGAARRFPRTGRSRIRRWRTRRGRLRPSRPRGPATPRRCRRRRRRGPGSTGTSGSVSIASASAVSRVAAAGAASRPPEARPARSRTHPSTQLTAQQATDPGVLAFAAVHQPGAAGALDGEASRSATRREPVLPTAAHHSIPLPPLQLQLVEGPAAGQPGGRRRHALTAGPGRGPEARSPAWSRRGRAAPPSRAAGRPRPSRSSSAPGPRPSRARGRRSTPAHACLREPAPVSTAASRGPDMRQ